jgi:hypothetical protein
MSRRIALALAAVAVAVPPILVIAACGRLADTTPVADAAADRGTTPGDIPPATDGGPPTAPPQLDAAWDALGVDGAPMPCGDAAAAGGDCPLPPSTCIDEHTMRYYGASRCDDAGICEYVAFDMTCDPAPVPPDCYQGGCRVVIVR